MAAIGSSHEVIKNGQSSPGSDFEDISEAVGAALLGGPVQVAVDAQGQATDRSAAVSRIEVIKNLVGTGRRDLKNKALTIGAAAGDGSVQVPIPALRHKKWIL